MQRYAGYQDTCSAWHIWRVLSYKSSQKLSQLKKRHHRFLFPTVSVSKNTSQKTWSAPGSARFCSAENVVCPRFCDSAGVVADAAQTLEKLWRDLSPRCEQKYIKRRRHWSRFLGIPQNLSPFPLSLGSTVRR